MNPKQSTKNSKPRTVLIPMKPLLFLLLSLSPPLPVWSAEPPVKPSASAPASAWHAYDNAVAAWNQVTASEKQAALRQAELARQAGLAQARQVVAAEHAAQAEAAARAAEKARQNDLARRYVQALEVQNYLLALDILKQRK